MNRSEAEKTAEEVIRGETGLWLAVLISLMRDIEAPCRQGGYEEARRIILIREGCFDIMAAAFGLEPEELQKRILKALRKRGFGLTDEKKQNEK